MCPDDIDHNLSCNSDNHINHLCYLFSHGMNENEHDESTRELMDKPRYQCHICGRKANSDEQVCMPIEL